jgi:CRISPR/Cas system-associated exonuclease Cas4 (RecB family)
MISENELLEEYKEQLRKKAEKSNEDYIKAASDRRAQNPEVQSGKTKLSVTDLCAWSTYCPKKVYYDKTAKRVPTPESLMRLTLGNIAHEMPLWEEGNEIKFVWDDFTCRMDEIDTKRGIIVDKKTVSSLPGSPREYVTKQLNVYKVIAENNDEKPFKVKQLFALNICVINGDMSTQEIPIWPESKTMDFIKSVSSEIRYHVDNKIAPNILYGSKKWLCSSCQYCDLCRNDDVKDMIPQPDSVQNANEDDTGITVTINKKK